MSGFSHATRQLRPAPAARPAASRQAAALDGRESSASHPITRPSPRVSALGGLQRSLNQGSGVTALAQLSALLQPRTGGREAVRATHSTRVLQRQPGEALDGAASGDGVVQLSGGRAGLPTTFLFPADTFDQSRQLEKGQTLEIVEPYAMDGLYIKVKVGDQTGWVPWAHLVPTAVEDEVARSVEQWDAALGGEDRDPLTSGQLNYALQLRQELAGTHANIDVNWPGFDVSSIHHQLHEYERAVFAGVRERFQPTVDRLFHLVSTSGDVLAHQDWIDFLQEAMATEGYQPFTEAVAWDLLLRAVKVGDFRQVYAAFVDENEMKGDPGGQMAEGSLTHRPAVIAPGTAFTSGTDTSPAPESRSVRKGREVQHADSRAGLTLAAADAKVYTRHERDAVTPSIYINGRPNSADVAQTALGDCYYLAVVSSIADRDPGRIRQVLPDPGPSKNVQATLYFMNGPNFLEQRITLDQGLAYTEGGTLKGARFRIEPTGKSRWILKQSSRRGQWIEEVRYYSTALWAPLLEKAYARFAEKHGQYGFALSTAKSGYDVITVGGNPVNVFRVFYGSQVQAETVEINSAAKVSTIQADMPDDYVKGVRTLAEFAKGGSRSAAQDPLMLMTAGASPRTIFQRVVTYAESMKPDDFSQFRGKGDLFQLVDTQLAILSDKLAELIRKSEGLADDDPRIGPLQSSAQNYSQSLLDFLNRGLGTDKPSPRLRHLMQLVLDVIGGEARATGSKRRFVYARHAYTVTDVRFVDKSGRLLIVDSSKDSAVKAAMRQMDWMKSTVTLVNPHHANSPDFYGHGGADTGRFTIWLTQFFRNFTSLNSGVVHRR